MDYNHYQSHSSLSYMTPAGFTDLCRQASGVRSHTPVLYGVQDYGNPLVESRLEKGADHIRNG